MSDINVVDAVEHFFSDGVYAKQLNLNAFHIAQTHIHNYSHLSILAKGRVVVTVEGHETEYTAPTCIEIKAGLSHSIEALEDSTFFCVHHTHETDVDKVDKVLIKEAA